MLKSRPIRGEGLMNAPAAVLDATCGSKMMWFDKSDDRAIFMDQRSENVELCDGRTLTVNPDVIADFREMPFSDNAFNLVVFDPPHIDNLGPKSWVRAKYGALLPTWRDDLSYGFKECFRVLKDGGVLIFKWNDTRIPTKDVLSLTDERPLFGHRSGKSAGTHWIAFIKDRPHLDLQVRSS